MCVIFFYANSNPAPGGYKLILASNRDEYYARQTLPVTQWSNAEHVYGGIDLEPGREGGTWLAISGQDGVFKVGALLNLTGEPKPRDVLGRGMIVTDYVKSSAKECSIEAYNRQLLADCTKYSAYNFISMEIGDSSTPARIMHSSNLPPSLALYANGECHAFGNSLPAVPFRKVVYGQQRFQQLVNALQQQQQQQEDQHQDLKREMLVNECMAILKCEERFWPDAELARRAPNWGVYLSALNVRVPDEAYGSRTHTVILVDEHNVMHFHEQTLCGLDPLADKWSSTHIEKAFFVN